MGVAATVAMDWRIGVAVTAACDDGGSRLEDVCGGDGEVAVTGELAEFGDLGFALFALSPFCTGP